MQASADLTSSKKLSHSPKVDGSDKWLQALWSEFKADRAFVIATLPNGKLTAAGPTADDVFARNYDKDLAAFDAATWQILAGEKSVALEPAKTARTTDPFARYLADQRWVGVAVALKSYLLPEFPAALHVYRDQSRGAFSAAEISRLVALAEKVQHVHEHSSMPEEGISDAGRHFQLVDRRGKFLLAQQPAIDSTLQQAISQDAKIRASHKPSDRDTVRIMLRDSKSILWSYRVSAHASLPGVSNELVFVYARTPSVGDWQQLLTSASATSMELTRLLPSMRFILNDFADAPGLPAIAKKAGLSAFHFHRQFSDLLGITPKHLMLDCQMDLARRGLCDDKANLVQIAKRCGFAHQSHFTSRFKQASGLTPTKWRRLCTSVHKAAQ